MLHRMTNGVEEAQLENYVEIKQKTKKENEGNTRSPEGRLEGVG